MFVNYKYTFTPFIMLSLLYYVAVCSFPISILDGLGIAKLPELIAKYSSIVSATLAWADNGDIHNRIPYIYCLVSFAPILSLTLGFLSRIDFIQKLKKIKIAHMGRYEINILDILYNCAGAFFCIIWFMQLYYPDVADKSKSFVFILVYGNCFSAISVSIVFQISGFLFMSVITSLLCVKGSDSTQ